MVQVLKLMKEQNSHENFLGCSKIELLIDLLRGEGRNCLTDFIVSFGM